mgnify:CR=1 FL=1
MSASRSVAVLGPIPRDRIITHRGEVFEKYGCALYTVAALSALLDADDRIYPIVHVRREDEEPIKELLSAFPNVDLTGVRSASDHGAVVELRYVDQNTRIEQQIGFMDPITPADVEFALHADAFVCVPITDYEVGQATLAYIKEHSAGTILLDAHGPTSTLVIGGERRRRLWVERDSWLPHIDLLKMNLEEAGCSWFPSKIALEHHDAGAPIATETLPEFAEHCLRHGVTAVCVTLDERGCAAYWLDENGEPEGQIYVPAVNWALDASPEVLDMLWGRYFASGEYRALWRIVTMLPWSKERDSAERQKCGLSPMKWRCGARTSRSRLVKLARPPPEMRIFSPGKAA